MAKITHKYGNLDSLTPDKAKAGDIIMANNENSGAIYISVQDGSVRKIGGDYDVSIGDVNTSIASLKDSIGNNGVYSPSDPSLTYISGASSIVDALNSLDKALKENGDNDEKTDSIDTSTIDSLFK